jgi:ribosome-binding factor A
MAVDRITRLNAQMQKELGALVESLVRPEVPGALVTITGVEIASTLRTANVYVSVYGGGAGAHNRVLEVLQKKRHIIQSDMAKKIILKYTPVLNFKLDNTAERADRVMNILKDLNLPDA